MAEHWHYLRVYVLDFDEIPVVLEQVVRPWLDTRADEIERWFYLRFMDATGVHLRLRLQLVDPWSSTGHDLEDRLWDWCAAATLADSRCVRFVLRRHYAPEHAKFGGAAGLELAHRISHLGSVAAADLLPLRDRMPVLALGAGHLTVMNATFAPLLSSTFMYQYGWYWTGRGTVGDGWATVVADSLARPEAIRFDAVRAVDVARRVVDDAWAGPVLRTYADAVLREVQTLRPEMWNHSVALVVHHHLHLMNNRLGVLPLQEAHLARMLYLGHRIEAAAAARAAAEAAGTAAAAAAIAPVAGAPASGTTLPAGALPPQEVPEAG
ncbi:thiopeptide-type bacteriocin biosynthesis protein [Terracoccus luteus]|uniref:Thiopeptide-type bacteriocin biosynthesis protein n=1 Tax=Terracoccus luteus TaxID=53356 RepID=A0A495Y3T1_9MICO|nr:thiopeptide-type bacteriocin biosynthesis protein [Terracoccus luteus]RKT79853.1 thiopeptide-type bacteriocin biosynthesis protein [Terracoccus luteus]